MIQSSDTNERMHGRNRYFRKPPDFGALAKMYAEFSKYVKIDSQVTYRFHVGMHAHAHGCTSLCVYILHVFACECMGGLIRTHKMIGSVDT
jgi:hypothetical protein